MKKIYLILLLITTFGYSQVGIGTTTPNGALDINSATNGVVVPNVALTSRALSAPVVNPNGGGTPLNGTLVWNTATAGTSPNNVVPGFYFWDSVGAVWQKIASGSGSGWSLSGNSGTTPGTDFIGTTDDNDFRIKTGATTTNRWNISHANAGQLQSYSLGTAALPTYSFQTDQDTGLFSSAGNALDFSTNSTARLRIPDANQVHALDRGTAALPFYSFSADPDIGVWSSAANNLNFSTAGVERVRIDDIGNVGIGTTAITASSILDMSSVSTKGVEFPNVALTLITTAAPVTGAVAGTVVYNTSTNAVANGVTPGYYYWDGLLWQSMSTSGQSATTYYQTASVSYTTGSTTFATVYSTGNITIPPNCTVLISADIGIVTQSAAANGYSAVDFQLIDGATIYNPPRRVYSCNTAQVVTPGPPAVYIKPQAYMSLTKAIDNLTPGLHNFEIQGKYPSIGGAGLANVTVGSNSSTSSLQGQITVTIIKK